MISTLETTGSLNRDPITAEHGASTVSERYGFISTRSLLDNLASEGFTPRSVQAARVIKPERQGYQKHIVRLRHESLMPKVGDHVPEIVLINSHDARSPLHMVLGIFRYICTNGLVTGEATFAHTFVHRDISLSAVNEAAITLARSVPQMTERIAQMQCRKMSQTETARFVSAAARLRWDENDKIRSQAAVSLERPRRYEDGTENTLWHVYNRVQENMVKGTRHFRRLTGITKDVQVNKGLWNLAAGFLN
jgi:hypothetical protein